MADQENVDYTVVLVFPGYGSERENAEAIVELALDWLNTYKDEPGFRFAYPVSAHLEMVSDSDDARERLESDDTLAMLLLHDVPEEERGPLLEECERRHIGACYTVDSPRPRGRGPGEMKVVFRNEPRKGPPAHRICAETLTEPVEEDEETGQRVGEVIAVLALGVMEHHWRLTHPMG
jgi:hypothetical protein